ncbi:MAG: hypothetical protein ACYTGH_16940 [Planctomycetota bacterium]|jgi:hypothetical protein
MRTLFFNAMMGLLALIWSLLWLPDSGLSIPTVFLFLVVAAFCGVIFLFLWKRKGCWRMPLISACVWAVLCNLLLNAAIGQKISYWGAFQSDPLLGWYPTAGMKDEPVLDGHGRPYLVTTDRHGHRSPFAPSAVHGIRVLVQGDSNVFGYGLAAEDILTAQLNRRTTSSDFYNAGVPGFDVNHYYYQYERLAKQFSIQGRLIVFNVDNDFTLSALSSAYFIRRPYLCVVGGEVRQVREHQNPFPGQGFDNEFVPPYGAFSALVHEPSRDWGDTWPLWLLQAPLGRRIISQLHPRVNRIMGRTRVGELAPTLYSPSWLLTPRSVWPQPYRDYAHDFVSILKALREQNQNTVICLLPMKEQVLRMRDDRAQAPLAFNRYFASACSQIGLSLVDPISRFVEEEDVLSLFQEDDEHLSPKGTKYIVDAVLETPAFAVKGKKELSDIGGVER